MREARRTALPLTVAAQMPTVATMLRCRITAIEAVPVLRALSLGFVTAAAALGLTLSFAVAQTFRGYPCTVDCSGHEAGYEWAERKGIEDPYDCGGNSNSFIEGCQAWAEEQQEQESSYGESPDCGRGP